VAFSADAPSLTAAHVPAVLETTLVPGLDTPLAALRVAVQAVLPAVPWVVARCIRHGRRPVAPLAAVRPLGRRGPVLRVVVQVSAPVPA
jgi:hypothetical protein